MLFLMHPDEVRDGAVIGSLVLFREEACRDLSIPPVIVETFAAPVLLLTWFVGAVTVFLEIFLYTLHKRPHSFLE